MKKIQEEGNPCSHEVDEHRWQAVCDRNQVWDGIFVFAVRTTGVYCRPNCTSRRANRENVSFYKTPSQPEIAGFRACQRCKPNQSEFSAHGDTQYFGSKNSFNKNSNNNDQNNYLKFDNEQEKQNETTGLDDNVSSRHIVNVIA